MEKNMVQFILQEEGRVYTCEIDLNEFQEKIRKIGKTQNDHMALTIEGIVPRMKKMLVDVTRNQDRDVPDLNYWEKGEKSARALSINRHHKDIWKVLNAYCKQAKMEKV